MTTILTKIEEMNLQVGTPIEIIYKGKKEQIYFQGLGNGFDLGGLMFYANEKTNDNKNILFAKGYFKDTSDITSIKKINQIGLEQKIK